MSCWTMGWTQSLPIDDLYGLSFCHSVTKNLVEFCNSRTVKETQSRDIWFEWSSLHVLHLAMSQSTPPEIADNFADSKTTSGFFLQICGEAGTCSLQVDNVRATLRACGHWHILPMEVKGVKMCLPPQKNWNCGSEKGKLRSKSFHKVFPLFLSAFSFFTNCTLYCYCSNANQILVTIVSPEHVHHCIEPSALNSGSLLEQC
jgi:hypothetical protein